MQVILYEKIEEFVNETWELIMQHEVQNNLLMGNAKRELGGGRANDLRVVVSDEQIRLIGMMTSPYNLVLYEVGNKPCEEAIKTLALELIQQGIELPGVIGETTLVQRFGKIYAPRVDKVCKLKLGLNLMILDKVNKPQTVSGRLRKATEEDLFFLPYWQKTFAEEAGADSHSIMESVESLKKIINNQNIWIWEDGYPVSCVIASRPLENAMGIGFVYTPPMYRGKGYAKNCVAQASEIILGRGYQQCYLFADQKNPISNGIYQKIGYEYQGIFESILFEEIEK